jgi:hypothetical protein
VLRVPADAELRMLELIILSDLLTMRLYTNLREPSDADLTKDFTEPALDAYRGIDLQAAEWVLTPGEPGKPALAVHPAIRWRFAEGPETPLRGYFVTWSDGRLAWCEPFKREQIVENEGDSITIIPKFNLRDLNEV